MSTTTVPQVPSPGMPVPELPQPVTIISPFPTKEAPRIWNWIAEFRHRVSDDYGPTNLYEFMEQWLALEKQQKSYGVMRGKELGGMISITRHSPYLASSHCLFKKAFWGKETTDQALRMVYDEVFGSGIRKISSLAFKDNGNIIHMAKRMGAVVEGTFRNHTMRGGRPVDMVSIGLTAEDFEEAKKNVTT